MEYQLEDYIQEYNHKYWSRRRNGSLGYYIDGTYDYLEQEANYSSLQHMAWDLLWDACDLFVLGHHELGHELLMRTAGYARQAIDHGKFEVIFGRLIPVVINGQPTHIKDESFVPTPAMKEIERLSGTVQCLEVLAYASFIRTGMADPAIVQELIDVWLQILVKRERGKWRLIGEDMLFDFIILDGLHDRSMACFGHRDERPIASKASVNGGPTKALLMIADYLMGDARKRDIAHYTATKWFMRALDWTIEYPAWIPSFTHFRWAFTYLRFFPHPDIPDFLAGMKGFTGDL